jgi:hypothetical protein
VAGEDGVRPTGAPQSFEEWWDKHGTPYEAAVVAGGGTPWALDPVKRAATAAQLGLPEDTDPMELRRALWARRYKRSNAA